jgi:hypothetical protein
LPRDLARANVSPVVNHRDPLSTLLKSWRHEPPSEPRFNSGVWARIEAGRRESGALSFYRWALPLAACLAVVLGAGTALRESRRQHTDRMAAAYVRNVDPLQMPPYPHSP